MEGMWIMQKIIKKLTGWKVDGWVGFWVGRIVMQCAVLAISWERRKLLEIRWCPNDQIFEGVSNFKKNDFWISGFLDFLLDFWLYLGNKKSYQRPAGVKTTGFPRAFWISGFLLDFWQYLRKEKSYRRPAGVKTKSVGLQSSRFFFSRHPQMIMSKTFSSPGKPGLRASW